MQNISAGAYYKFKISIHCVAWASEDMWSATVHHGAVLLADSLAVDTLHFYSLLVVWRVGVVRFVVWVINIFGVVLLLLALRLRFLLVVSVLNCLVD